MDAMEIVDTDGFFETILKRPDLSNATARIAAWMIGAAAQAGGFPLKLSLRQIAEGFEHDGVRVPGTGSRLETIQASLAWLEEHGYLTSERGERSNGRAFYQHYTLDF